MIQRIPSSFRTADGKIYPTWNSARKHQTWLNWLDELHAQGCELSDIQRNAMFIVWQNWNISRKRKKP